MPKSEDEGSNSDTMTLDEDSHNPSFETVLRSDSDDGSTIPPPPPPTEMILKDLRNMILRSGRNKRKGSGGEPSEFRPIDIVAIHDHDQRNGIELEAGYAPWCKSSSGSSVQQNSPLKRRALLCAGLLLFVVVILGLAIGLSGDKDTTRGSGSSNMLVGGDTQVAANETSVPTLAATSTIAPSLEASDIMSSTIAPTDGESSTGCTSFVQPLETCQTPFLGFSVYFQNCEPTSGDWVGIWNVNSIQDESSLPEPLLWLYHCGSQNCDQEVEEDVLFFGEGLPPGNYVAHLARFLEYEPPYTSSYAVTETFQVAPTCT